MLHICGENPVEVLKRTAHHARSLLPLVEALSLALLYEGPGTDDAHHTIWQSRGGANSFSLHMADGRKYHFRGEASNGTDYDHIAVYDQWRYKAFNATPLVVLNTVEECRAFARSLKTAAQKAA